MMNSIFRQAEIIINSGIIVDVVQCDDATVITDISSGLPISTLYPAHHFLPAFIDSHIHLFGLGMRIETLSLYDSVSLDDCIEKCKIYNGIYRGDWLVGIGWNEAKWKDKQLPDRHILDAFFPNTPVYLIRADGHTAWCNSLALEIAGINCQSTVNSEWIGIDKCGFPSGIIENQVKELVYSKIPKFTTAQEKRILLSAQSRLLQLGIGTVCDMDTELSSLKALRELDNENKLILDVYSYLNPQNYYIDKRENISNSEHCTVKGIKIFADGTLGGHTAALSEPYSDNNGIVGGLLMTQNQIAESITIADSLGLDIAIHCIGDRANDVTADATLTARSHGASNIVRIEHCQVIKEQSINKFVDADIIASIQPTHCLSDAPDLLNSRLGSDRIADAYRWKSLVDSGINLISGSDSPVESEDPFIGMDALSNRIPFTELNTWNKSEKLTYKYAFGSYTNNPSELLNLKQGKIEKNKQLDILLINSKLSNNTDLCNNNIQLFIKKAKKIKK